ncbi:DUF5655 domain-containing protein [Solidesulfovibrio sp.]|uniref:DUF5655 domain-containing protein n=1 Tax=Solidesulfovibrio sp. TaxID=2910990 RepID=UPI002B200D89|nr:DUF5655 domain-containing protein [Solidesulfovibrio sp.]MEA4856553.1 DUF5655 domain-containing protein [Solidesulfovibrio sp.]
MSDIKLFRINQDSVAELHGQSLALEKSLQTLMEQHLDALLGVRFLASEYSTGVKHKGRIDTLGIDENGCPVIIEYKRATNENVINQGLFYLDWLMDHQAEFKLLVLERYGRDAANTIEWGSPRLLCIAGDFTRYDEHAVAQINRNIELIRYRHYPEGFLILEMVNAVTGVNGSASPAPSPGGGHAETDRPAVKTVSDYLSLAQPEVKDLYHALEDYLLALGDDVTKKVLKHYIAFKRIKNFACVEVGVQAKRLVVAVKCPPTPENIIEGLTRDVRNIGHLGTGDMEITINTMDDFERAKPFLEKSYQAS